MNRNINYRKMPKERVDKLKKEGLLHLHFAISIALKQLRAGRHFLFEHPRLAVSWQDNSLKSLMNRSDVHCSDFDQCEHGPQVTTPEGVKVARKATRFLSSSPFMNARLSKRCRNDHEHHALNGRNIEQAAFYPVGLRLAILRGIRDTSDHDMRLQEELDNIGTELIAATRACHQPVNAYPLPVAAAMKQEDAKTMKSYVTPFKVITGESIKVNLAQNLKPEYVDEYTREVLPPDLMAVAISDELS